MRRLGGIGIEVKFALMRRLLGLRSLRFKVVRLLRFKVVRMLRLKVVKTMQSAWILKTSKP